jgi:hypothetical protein
MESGSGWSMGVGLHEKAGVATALFNPPRGFGSVGPMDAEFDDTKPVKTASRTLKTPGRRF